MSTIERFAKFAVNFAFDKKSKAAGATYSANGVRQMMAGYRATLEHQAKQVEGYNEEKKQIIDATLQEIEATYPIRE